MEDIEKLWQIFIEQDDTIIEKKNNLKLIGNLVYPIETIFEFIQPNI